MIVNVRGTRNQDLIQELKNATQFFASELLSRQLMKHVTVDIEMCSNIQDLGNCTVTYYNDWYKPREFEIQLKRNRSRKNTLITLAHEVVHLKQFAKSELNTDLTLWKKQRIDPEEMSYFDLPWEVEASSLEYLLYAYYQEEKHK